MSFTLRWFKPPSPRRPLNAGGDTTLKYILARRYLDQDGSLKGTFHLNAKDLPFLEGLEAAGVEDARTLREDLAEHGQLDLEIDD